MATSENNLRTLFATAESVRKAIESSWEPNSPEYQSSLRSAITSYEQCRELSQQLGIFSGNEMVDDVSSGDLKYFLINCRLAELVQKSQSSDRTRVLRRASESYGYFLGLLDSYDLLSKQDKQLWERFQSSPSTFSTTLATDPATRRDTKIARFREEKQLKMKLEHLHQNPTALENDDEALRTLHLLAIRFCTHETFAALESIALELQLLAHAPPATPPDPNALARDYRERDGRGAPDRDDRLDRSTGNLSSGTMAGPILSKDGKPLRPFTLLDTRESVRRGVFKSGHNLPTMTIDEYLEEERRRGGIIEGGGEESGRKPEPDEDNYERADQETMKAREWDEFTEENPKGSGNTLNRG